MTRLATRIATTTSGAGTTYAQSRAVRLDMPKALTMVALLSFTTVSVTILEISVRVLTYFRWCEGVGSHLIHALLWRLDALGLS